MRLVENTSERFELRHRPWLAAGLSAAWTLAFLAGGAYSLVAGDLSNLLVMVAGVALGLLAWRLLARPRFLVADAPSGQITLTEGRRVRRWPLAQISGAHLAQSLVRSAGYSRVYWVALDFTDGRKSESVWSTISPRTTRRFAETLDAWLRAARDGRG